MLCSRLLPYGCLFAIAANAQDSSSLNSGSSPSSESLSFLTGASLQTTPTGSYLSYASTITVSSSVPSSAITTSALLSTVTRGSSERTTTVGSTTIFGVNGTPIIAQNTTASGTGTQSAIISPSQLILQGSSHTTHSLNGTRNSTATSTSTSAQPTNTTPCNNYPQFCERKYGNITEVAAHNSPFIKPGNAAANQALPVTTQLNDGIRLLQGQMHFVNSTPHFCHTSCDILDAGPITDYLGTVYDWVATHPYDVVTILLGNGGYNPVTDYVPFLEQTGLQNFAYEPPKIPMGLDDWPTLASMILTGKRVVFFMDYEANQTAVPWILDEFSQMWETPFDPTDRNFPCDVQRPPNLSAEDAKNRLYLANHNLNYDINLLGTSLLVPYTPLLNVTNNVTGYGSLGMSATNCNQTWGFPPKFLNVDYYNVGNGSVFEVAATWNNVTYNRPCCGLPVSAAGKNDAGNRWALIGLVAGATWLLL